MIRSYKLLCIGAATHGPNSIIKPILTHLPTNTTPTTSLHYEAVARQRLVDHAPPDQMAATCTILLWLCQYHLHLRLAARRQQRKATASGSHTDNIWVGLNDEMKEMHAMRIAMHKEMLVSLRR
jgi:hypothetical protein